MSYGILEVRSANCLLAMASTKRHMICWACGAPWEEDVEILTGHLKPAGVNLSPPGRNIDLTQRSIWRKSYHDLNLVIFEPPAPGNGQGPQTEEGANRRNKTTSKTRRRMKDLGCAPAPSNGKKRTFLLDALPRSGKGRI